MVVGPKLSMIGLRLVVGTVVEGGFVGNESALLDGCWVRMIGSFVGDNWTMLGVVVPGVVMGGAEMMEFLLLGAAVNNDDGLVVGTEVGEDEAGLRVVSALGEEVVGAPVLLLEEGLVVVCSTLLLMLLTRASTSIL